MKIREIKTKIYVWDAVLLLSSAALPAVSFRTCRPCRGLTRGAFPYPRLRYAYLGLLKYHLSEVRQVNHHSLKHGAISKSHAALRFLPLRNCVVSSVKKRELSEATRNGMQCCKFSRFNEKRPILGKNRAAAKRISFGSFSFCNRKENEQI